VGSSPKLLLQRAAFRHFGCGLAALCLGESAGLHVVSHHAVRSNNPLRAGIFILPLALKNNPLVASSTHCFNQVVYVC
jgi:hypothetical protein